jgi:hypothetical protein
MKTLVPLFALGFVLLNTVASFTQRPALRFSRPSQLAIANDALTGAAAGDFNADGRMDLAVGAPASGLVHVAIADRRGTFAAPVGYPVAPGRGHLAVADFNNDAALDIVFAGAGIAVLLGNGDGTFLPPVVSFGSAADVVVADFDGDGAADIASVGKNSVSTIPDTVDVYPGHGDGTFGAPRTLATSDNGPAALAAGDVNGDGRPDLLFGLRDIRQLHVFLNAGDFAFTPFTSAFIEVGPSRTVLGDLTGDGTLDVVTANFLGSVSVFSGNGDGTLGLERTYPACGASLPCAATQWAALADLDGNGALDIVTAHHEPGSASVLLNDGTGAFGAPLSLDVLTFAYAAVPGDFDGDGAIDVAVTSSDAAFVNSGERVVSTFLTRPMPPLWGRRR